MLDCIVGLGLKLVIYYDMFLKIFILKYGLNLIFYIGGDVLFYEF